MDDFVKQRKENPDQFEIMVVTKGRTLVFPNLSAARRQFPDLHPEKGSAKFTPGSFLGISQKSGKPVMRFESRDVEKLSSQWSS